MNRYDSFAQDSRKYNMKEKGVCKMLARVWNKIPVCNNDALVKDFTEKGDVGATAQNFFEREEHCFFVRSTFVRF